MLVELALSCFFQPANDDLLVDVPRDQLHREAVIGGRKAEVMSELWPVHACLYKGDGTNQDGWKMRAGIWIVALGWLLTAAIRAPADDLGAGVKAWALKVPQGGSPGFTLMPGSQTGILFTNELLSWPEATNQNLLNGAGVALGDYDGDGWCDIFLCSLNGSSRLYRNLGGWKFQDVTESAGLANTNLLARGAVFADVNGDGALDLLVTYSGRGTRLFLNDGAGHFRDAQATELADNTGSMSMALGDVNGDGSLDLYVANYGENTIRSGMKVSTRIVNGKEQVIGRYRNRLRLSMANW